MVDERYIAPKGTAYKIGKSKKVSQLPWEHRAREKITLERIIAREEDCLIIQYDMYAVEKLKSPFHKVTLGEVYVHRDSVLGAMFHHPGNPYKRYSDLTLFRDGKYVDKHTAVNPNRLISVQQISIIGHDGKNFVTSNPTQARVTDVETRAVDDKVIYEAVIRHNLMSMQRQVVFLTVDEGKVSVLGTNDPSVQKLISYNQLYSALTNV